MIHIAKKEVICALARQSEVEVQYYFKFHMSIDCPHTVNKAPYLMTSVITTNGG